MSCPCQPEWHFVQEVSHLNWLGILVPWKSFRSDSPRKKGLGPSALVWMLLKQSSHSIKESSWNFKETIYYHFLNLVPSVVLTTCFCEQSKRKFCSELPNIQQTQMFTQQSKTHTKVHGPLVNQTIYFGQYSISGLNEFTFWRCFWKG